MVGGLVGFNTGLVVGVAAGTGLVGVSMGVGVTLASGGLAVGRAVGAVVGAEITATVAVGCASVGITWGDGVSEALDTVVPT